MEFNNNNNNNFLPEEISINIISRLPTMSVFRCRLVCKSWRDLIICKIIWNLEFARMHLLRGLESHHHHHAASSAYYNGRFNFLLQTDLGSNKGYQIYYTLDDNYNYEENPEPRLRLLCSNPNISYDNKNYYAVGSCNGLICMAYANISGHHHGFEQPVYICNPITREWLTLPSLTINECCSSCSTNDNNDDPTSVSIYCKVVCGFGYLPSTDEYKVVRITYCKHGEYLGGTYQECPKSSEARVHVYTLGDGTGWRDKGEIISYELAYYVNPHSILANGALHWLEEYEGSIVAFDLADEEFLLLPPTPCFIPYDDDDYPFQIQVLGGQLCAFHPKDCLTVSMWFLKNKNKEEKNGSNYKDGNGRLECQSWIWIKEFDIERDLKRFFNPFILTEHGDVLYYSCERLFCYDLKTATSKELVGMVKCVPSDFYCLEAIPHLNSFISLKALGEEDTKVIESPH